MLDFPMPELRIEWQHDASSNKRAVVENRKCRNVWKDQGDSVAGLNAETLEKAGNLRRGVEEFLIAEHCVVQQHSWTGTGVPGGLGQIRDEINHADALRRSGAGRGPDTRRGA